MMDVDRSQVKRTPTMLPADKRSEKNWTRRGNDEQEEKKHRRGSQEPEDESVANGVSDLKRCLLLVA